MKNTLRFTLSALCLLLITPQMAWAAPTTAVLGGGVCINEILIDPTGTTSFDTDDNDTAAATDEFIELYNLSGSAVDISGWQIWDSSGQGNWFTFAGAVDSGTIVLQSNSYAVVVIGVQSGGTLPTMTNPNSLIFDAGRGSAVLANDGDNIILYDPGEDEYIHILYNGDTVDDATAIAGFSSTAMLVGSIEDWGNDGDGQSLTRYPSGDTAVGQHSTITPGGELASPTAVSLHTLSASPCPTSLMTAFTLMLLAASAYALRRRPS